MSRTYAFADLHGRFDLLEAAFSAISKHACSTPNKIITLGDYIDRGPQSRQVIEHLMAAQSAGMDLICLKGNHEDIAWQTLRKPLHPSWWLGNGGGATLISYGRERSGDYRPEVVPAEHIDWMNDLPLMHVDRHRVFVHAGVDRFKPLDQQDQQTLTWKIYDSNDDGGHDKRHVVHGHKQFSDGPIIHRGRTDLDTFAWYTGRLVVGVFADDMPGGAFDFIEVTGKPAS